LIFVGVTDRLLEVTRSAKAIGRGCGWLRLLGFDSRLRSTPPALVSSAGVILPWALPLAGLSGTLPCIATGSTPRAITSLRTSTAGNSFAADTSNPLMGFRDAPSDHAQQFRATLRRPGRGS
jgi:hypothetical protein